MRSERGGGRIAAGAPAQIRLAFPVPLWRRAVQIVDADSFTMILRLTMFLLLSYGIISFVEHIIHRYFMHMKWLPTAVYRACPFFHTTYEAHAVRHHGRWYRRFDYEPNPAGRLDNLTFKLSDSLAMLIAALPVWAPLIFLSPFGGCVFVASAFVHNRLWNALHRQMHIPEDVFFKDWKIYRFLARYHFMHHQMNERNFNVVFPLADLVLRRTAKPRVRDIREMLTLGLLDPRRSRLRHSRLDQNGKS